MNKNKKKKLRLIKKIEYPEDIGKQELVIFKSMGITTGVLAYIALTVWLEAVSKSGFIMIIFLMGVPILWFIITAIICGINRMEVRKVIYEEENDNGKR